LSATLNLPPGIYYWSVQAVDGAFAGSPFAQEEAFEVDAAVELPQFTGISPQPGGNFQLSAVGQAGYSYTLQGSTNLTKWTNITAVTMGATGATQYVYTNSSHLAHQFFRLQAPQ